MKNWAAISTWSMSYDGLVKAGNLLKKGANAGDAVENLIMEVESYPLYKSVGYGGLPNENGVVQMDAAFMNGDTLSQGSVAAIENVKHAVSVARKLSLNKTNSFLVGEGATKFAMKNGFEMTNMLTERAKAIWQEKVKEQAQPGLHPYDGHDTVGAITLDQNNSMAAATSTSGLFMKKEGRIGDSPLSGSGFYADSNIGAAAATGLGEDIMKGCLSYEIVRKMSEGMSPQQACDAALYPFCHNLKHRYGQVGEISLIALNNKGEWGVATNVEFPFCVACNDQDAKILMANPGKNNKTQIEPISQTWLDNYQKEINAPVGEKF
ncbi:N(4)-(beta-N-acetylglucosaminyl)-L-asparaginase [Lactobacillus sp. M0398]|uniref:N(4)-(beta-N-acetylglucosaminyl)-L-asparaginase n=1 Tax=unclassified Lactobacillus TaxID=2620435 RepID=UPI0018DBC290|nr:MULTISPECIES: N(4)-(beta-N-acetylglucosaminyl)-L-asparaginase [unclassified Lactobacillus]MBI0120233.1 N(4)-(beta-N-acetylglucosaminyl)-L-asparaginase [Lactobacillus sp. M0398]MBI0122381.1 N(4)-(beta-N-acetylglucosaminyl)-L-asparaginase [Lactobacillus sp. W8174]MBI0134555.1 N(4)-(beta-N-acetylglucosaminyl)-L-asparaginase [Lactobacillus sp. W8173]